MIAQPLDGAPTTIVYIPEGDHVITPTVDGRPGTVTVRVPPARGQEIAAHLQNDLDKRKGQNVRAWFDFDHQPGPASALPQSFRYEPGKGIVCALEWTRAGKAAIEGRDFSYFSPTFLIDDDGTPSGLPDRGSFGALVNEPAFREIPRIAASDASLPPVRIAAAHHGSPLNRLILAVADSGLTGIAAVRAAEAAEPGLIQAALAVKVRPDTLRKIAENMREAAAGSASYDAWYKLQGIADNLRGSGAAANRSMALAMAYDQRPDLFQIWQDAQAGGKVSAAHRPNLDGEIGRIVQAENEILRDAAVVEASDAIRQRRGETPAFAEAWDIAADNYPELF